MERVFSDYPYTRTWNANGESASILPVDHGVWSFWGPKGPENKVSIQDSSGKEIMILDNINITASNPFEYPFTNLKPGDCDHAIILTQLEGGQVMWTFNS